MAAGAGGRGARGGASRCKVPREEWGRSAGEGGRNGDATRRPRVEAETGRRKTTARGRETADTERRGQGQDQDQLSSNGDWGELRKRDGQEESDDASEEWSGRSADDSGGSDTEEDRMTAGGPEERRETLTVSPWGTQESGAGAVQGGVRDDGSDTVKSPSAAAEEEGARGRHGARPAQGGGKGGRRREEKR